MNKNAYPSTAMGVDPSFTDTQILNYLKYYFKGDNSLTDLANIINLIPGTGWFMPPCTLHAPGSLVTYELQTASDVTCIPESRVNDVVMPPDLIDRDLPVTIKKDGFEKACKYMLSMIKCKNSGNRDNFRKEYFRPPVVVRNEKEGMVSFVIYRTGKMSEKKNPDLYSAKRTIVNSGGSMELKENGAFGAIVLGGHGEISVSGKEPLRIKSVSIFPTRDDIGSDEFFVGACAAGKLKVTCHSVERLSMYQHFASGTNPESQILEIPEYIRFEIAQFIPSC